MKLSIGDLFKNKFFWIATVVFLFGIFLRVYHFDDWLHFELDQARDVFIISNADSNGFSEMPLLGPQARGRDLQLGPIFYYFQYTSAKIFGVSPVTIAFPDLLFSILLIPLSYLFSRQFFSGSISLLLSLITASSLFLVTYGRFAWNPNAMPFWTMLSVYALMKVSGDFSGKNILSKVSWRFVLSVFSL
ncbi:glycosyltransferase family 39 protein, partial [Patescibacteria group bacterium]